MTRPRLAPLDRRLLAQFLRYGVSGAAAVVALFAVLTLLIEVAAAPPILASLLAFVCATLVNYTLQHRFVFARSRGHHGYLPRYLAVTLATMSLNTALFSALDELGLDYALSQAITLALIVPINFAINRSFTFADQPVRPVVQWLARSRRAGSA